MIWRAVRQSVLWHAFLAVLLFVPAGTLAWPAGWAFLILMAICGMAITLWLARHDPALLAERLGSPIQRDQKSWDKALLGGVVVLSFIWLAFMPLDAVRFGWSHVPLALQAIGALALVVCMWIWFLTFRENTFAAPVVKIQTERAQTVVTTGPYAYVRHPMYGAAIFYFAGIPLLLGSWYGLAFAPVFIIAFAVRAVMEERTLTAELAGYADYAARVRYRLIPGVW
jgi:protein-S-isoprenylcysteine O-methyltransferase Ste14